MENSMIPIKGRNSKVAKKVIQNKKLFKSEDKLNIGFYSLNLGASSALNSKKNDICYDKDSIISNSKIMKDSLENSLANDITNNLQKTKEVSQEDSLERWKTPTKNDLSLDKNEDFIVKNFELEEFSTDKNSLENNSKIPGYKCQYKINSLNTTNVKVTNLTVSHSYSVIKSPKEQLTVKKNRLSSCFSPLNLSNKHNKETLYWFAAYDKFLDKSKIISIFGKKFQNFEENLTFYDILLKDFEICFNNVIGSYRPYIKLTDDGSSFVRLYLMTVNQLCLMYNYVNKNDIFEKLEEEELEFNNRKGSSFTKNNEKPYGEVICLGNYLSRPIFSFTCNKSRIESISINIQRKEVVNKNICYLVKFCKLLIKTFPSYSVEFFLYHIYSRKGVSSILSINEFASVQKQLFNDSKKANIPTEKNKLKPNNNAYSQKTKNFNNRNNKLIKSSDLLTKKNESFQNNYSKANEISLKKITSNRLENLIEKKKSSIFNLTNNKKLNSDYSNSANNVFVVTRDKKSLQLYSYEEESESSEDLSQMMKPNTNQQTYLTPKKN